jgi:hypothetical protein
MGHVLFILGGISGIASLISNWISYRFCKHIAKATSSDPDGLKHTETWLNSMHFAKRRKLARIAQENIELRETVKKALKYESVSFLLFITAMVLMFIGANLSQ